MDNDIIKFYNISNENIVPTIKILLENLKKYIINAKKGEYISLNLLKEYHQFSKLRSLVGLMNLISNNDKWIEADNMLTEYINEYYQDKKLFELINSLDKNKFYSYLIKNFEKNKFKNFDLLKNKILFVENKTDDYKELLIMQHQNCIELKYTTILESILPNDTDIIVIKKIIDDLLNKLNKKINHEISQIYKKNNNKKINRNNVIQYYNMDIPSIPLNKLFNYLFDRIENFFNLKIEEIDIDNKILFKKFICKKNNKINGYLYLGKNNQNKLNECLTINLEDNINNNPSNVLFLLNHDWNDQINFNEVQQIFYEFGYTIRYLIYQSEYGLLNLDNEYDSIYPYIMTFILWDSINSLYNCNNNYINLFKSFLSISLCFDSIDAIYDHLVHNSVKLIECIGNNKSSNLLTELYITVSKETFNNKMIKHEFNSLIINEFINGMQGYIYTKITNRILAYSIFNYIKTNPNSQIQNDIFNNGTDSYRKILKNFTNNYSNGYKDFLQFLLS